MNSKRSAISLLSLLLAGCVEFIANPGQLTPVSPAFPNTLLPIPTTAFSMQPNEAESSTHSQSSPQEIPIQTITLAGPIASSKAEISGMTWYGEWLILLPQYPEKFIKGSGSGSLFALRRDDILAYIAGSISQPLTPRQIAFDSQSVSGQVPGYEGFEAIAFNGHTAYLTIEANQLGTMTGYIIKGTVDLDLEEIKLDPPSLTSIPNQVQIFNASNESLLIIGEQILTLYEANGTELNSRPIAHTYDKSLLNRDSVEIPNIEYRITDATEIDNSGRFWVSNIYFPVEFWFYTSSDPLSEDFGKGETHARFSTVERLIELQYNGGMITFTGTPPIQLELINDFNSRNWEALARIDDLGFLVMTDTYPETILGFVPYP